MTFADMLDERGIRQSQIARAAGLTRQRVNEVGQGRARPEAHGARHGQKSGGRARMTIDEFESRL